MTKRLKIISAICAILCLYIAPGTSQSDAHSREQIEKAAKTIIDSSEYCTLITVDESGLPNARIMQPFPMEADFSVWLGTNLDSRKVTQIKGNANVMLFYFDAKKPAYVSMSGKATLVDDPELLMSFWRTDWAPFYPEFPKGYLLIHFIPESLEILSPPDGIVGDDIHWTVPNISFPESN